MSKKTLRLWTIQTALAWSLLQEKKVLSGDGRRVDRFFKPAYRWLKEQMAVHITEYGGRYPIWFWTHKPDFRQYRYWNYSKPGIPIVLLECLVPEERVLLSDYESWHIPLNNGYLALDEAEWDAWYARCDAGHITSEQAEQEKRESWQRVFDFELLKENPDWNGPPGDVQATVEVLRLEEVVKARTMTLKRPRH